MKRQIFLLLVLPLLFLSCNFSGTSSTDSFINSSQTSAEQSDTSGEKTNTSREQTESSSSNSDVSAEKSDTSREQTESSSSNSDASAENSDAEQKTDSSTEQTETSSSETDANETDKSSESESQQNQNSQNLNPNDYKFLTLHKENQSKDFNNYIIVFLGDGFTKDEQNLFEEKVKVFTQKLLSFEPFKTYKNQISVYGISTVSNESGISSENSKKDSYLKVLRNGNYFRFSDEDKKYETLIELLEKTFDQEENQNSTKVSTIHVVCNENSEHGGSLNPRWSFSTLSTSWPNGETVIHELAHSIGRLGDEYRVLKETFNTSKNKENPAWKKFIGFKGIGIFEPKTQPSQNVYIPSHSCIMNENLDSAFCEVCKWALACRLNSALYRKNHESIYIAQSEIISSTQKADTYEFKTIIQNFENQNRKIKLILKNKSGIYKTQEEFNLPSLNVPYPDNFDDFENSCILISASLFAPSSRQIEAQIINSESNEILASFKNY